MPVLGFEFGESPRILIPNQGDNEHNHADRNGEHKKCRRRQDEEFEGADTNH